ncbi:MAG: type VI secretion system-associated FHA domain protein TagH [Zoogloeaceae bacterium]|nr:type VI secretion system-associated FHA domain protein TagH [Zoogloeaceae bacterium]
MLVIRVIALQGKTTTAGPSFDFGEAGGSIGRADSNQLVLEDAERVISRVQARIVYRGGGFELVDQGANPTIVNGQRVGNGASMPLKVGDQLEIGAYRLEVVLPGRGSQTDSDPLGLMAGLGPEGHDPFKDIAVKTWPKSEDLLGGLGGGEGPPPASVDDPLGLFAGFDATPLPISRPPVTEPGFNPPKSGQGKPLIPDDFDPFADPFAPKVAPKPTQLPLDDDALGLGLGSTGKAGGGVDNLFGLDAPAGSDPFAGTPLGEAAPRSSGLSVDPLELLGGEAAPTREAAAEPDQVPAVHQAFTPPKPAASEPSSPASTPPPPSPDASGVFLSWENAESEEGVARTMILSPGSKAGRETAAPATPEPAEAPKDEVAQPAPPAGDEVQKGAGARDEPVLPSDGPTWWRTPVVDSAEGPASPTEEGVAPKPPQGRVPLPAMTELAAVPASLGAVPPGGTPVEVATLAAALARGLGLPRLPAGEGLTPELMERVGVLLRESTQGTLDLLLARAMTKREVRADVTMIFSKGNNPLKFSPDVSVALNHLLNPQGRGFLGPEEALKDAYDDLRAHLLGFMAGMRAAVEGLLRRFGPEVLEERLTDKSMLDSLLPMNRRAKLWDQYQQLYRQIAEEAEEDFHAVLGREFVKAYEEQVALLNANKKRDG